MSASVGPAVMAAVAERVVDAGLLVTLALLVTWALLVALRVVVAAALPVSAAPFIRATLAAALARLITLSLLVVAGALHGRGGVGLRACALTAG